MKERPILFSGPMVRAILDGRKTMTRRVIKNAPELLNRPEIMPSLIEAYKAAWVKTCPYGQPGDRLWVRETWAAQHEFDGHSPRFVKVGARFHYRASEQGPSGLLWRPSIHMPRWASRLTLEITAVRVERVQDIGDEDAEREGLQWCNAASPRDKFQCLWDSLNAKRGYGWATNPRVRVISFKKVSNV